MSAHVNKWVIVSGAAGALGSAIAKHYLSQGKNVFALDQKKPPFDGDVTHQMRSAIIDLTSADAVEGALKQISGNDQIELLVNAVGLIWNEPIITLRGARMVAHDIGNWRRVIEANLTASFIVASRVASRMARQGGGAIVNLSSISARGNAGQVAYSAAKAAIEGMTRAMALELGPMRVRVNAIAPGFIDVASTREALLSATLGDYERRTPLQRLGTENDLIQTVEFLAQNTFITGAVIDLDGGIRI